MRFKKSLTILLAICFLATLMLSLTFIVENSHHDCTGHDCVICQMLETAEEITGGGKTEDCNTASTTLNPFFTESQPVIDDNNGAVISTPVLLHDLLTI